MVAARNEDGWWLLAMTVLVAGGYPSCTPTPCLGGRGDAGYKGKESVLVYCFID